MTVPLTSVTYSGTTATLTFPALPENVYRLTVLDAITNSSGVKLDGNDDGTAGGNWITDFVVIPSSTQFSWHHDLQFDGRQSPGHRHGGLQRRRHPRPGRGQLQFHRHRGDPAGQRLRRILGRHDVQYGRQQPYQRGGRRLQRRRQADLAVANYGSNTIGILTGDGNGTFNPQSPTTGGTNPEPWPREISTATASSIWRWRTTAAARSASFLNGNGTFGAASTFTSGGYWPDALAVADFNGDGKPDLAVANDDSRHGRHPLGQRQRHDFRATSVPTGHKANRTAAASLPSATSTATATPTWSWSTPAPAPSAILLGTGNGTVPPPPPPTSTGGTWPQGVAVGDFNATATPTWS